MDRAGAVPQHLMPPSLAPVANDRSLPRKARGDRKPARLKDQPGPRPHHNRKKNDLRFAATEPLFLALGVDLTEIRRIDVGTALVILA
jgi:hypothetical protein